MFKELFQQPISKSFVGKVVTFFLYWIFFWYCLQLTDIMANTQIWPLPVISILLLLLLLLFIFVDKVSFLKLIFPLTFLLTFLEIVRIDYLSVLFFIVSCLIFFNIYPNVFQKINELFKSRKKNFIVLSWIALSVFVVLYRFLEWEKNIYLIFALIAFSFINIILVKTYQDKESDKKNFPKTFTIVLIVAIILFGSVLRTWKTWDYSLNVDEAITANTAIGFIQTQEFKFPATGIPATRAVLNTIVTAYSIIFFGDNEFAARLPSVVFGIGCLLLLWWLAKQTKFKGAWWAILGLVISADAISNSQSARMYQQLQFFTLLSLIAFVYFIKKPKIFKFILLLFICGLAFFSHRSSMVLLPIFMFLAFVQYWREIFQWVKKYWFRLSLLLLVVIFVSFLKFSFIENLIFTKLVGGGENPFANLKIDLVPFFHLLRDYSLLFPLAILSAIYGRNSWPKRSLAMLWFLVALILDILVYAHFPHYRTRYHYFIFPIFFLFAGEGLDIVLKQLSKIISNKVKVFVYFLLGVLLFMTPGFVINPVKNFEVYPEWKQTKEMLIDEYDIKQDDLIIAHPTSVAYYYFRRVDYWLVTHVGEIKAYSQDGVDIYGGGKVLSDNKEFENILSSKHGYLLIETGRYRFISDKIYNTLRLKADKISPAGNELEVWKF